VLAVGFQAEHTLGRRLIEGAEEVRLLGTSVPVRARVTAMHGFSAHADRDDLLEALRPLAKGARILFLVHGEDAARASLRADLEASGYRQIEEPMPHQNYSIQA
jgi:metallo-beta-lactamase family protein